jgi:hypothetical protein
MFEKTAIKPYPLPSTPYIFVLQTSIGLFARVEQKPANAPDKRSTSTFV